MMQDRELLSDIGGRITHILVGCGNPLDFREIVSIRAAFDEDVKVSVMYTSALDFTISTLKELVEKTGKDINCYPINGSAPLWMQDRLHVFKGKKVMSSLTPEEALRRKQVYSEYTADKTDAIFESDFWEANGFEVIPNDLGLYNTDGAELIPANKKLFVGSRLVTEYAHHDLNIPPEKRNLQDLEAELGGKLARLDPSRELVFVGVNHVPAGQHIDCFFTPLSDNEVLIQLPSGTLELMHGLHKNFTTDQKYFQHYEHDLANLGEHFIDLRYEVKPVLGLPPMHYSLDGKRVQTVHAEFNGLTISEFLVPYMTYNNILQESFSGNGFAVRRIYGPTYKLQEDVFKRVGREEDYKKLAFLNQAAYDMPGFSYKALIENVDIRTIPLGYRAYKIGSVRCSVKVLERE